jgi:hypothetical protein
MKKLVTKYLLSSLTLLTFPLCLQAGGPPNFAADVNVGYRQDEFFWKSRNPATPLDPTTSEKWENLQILDVNAFMNYTTCTSWYFRVNGNYGRIYSGHAVDKDYLQNGSSKVHIETNHGNAGKGEVFDVAGGAGFAFRSSGGRLMIAPLIGYIHSEQHLRFFDLNNTFLIDSNPIGRISGAHSTYNTRWYGGFAAYDLLLDWSCALKFFGTIQAEMGNYRGKAHWNLRDDINGYVYHKANFVGFYGTGGFIYNIFCHNYIGVSGSYRNLWTHHGSQKMNRRTYLYDLFGNYVGHTHEDHHQKMHARWRSWSVLANWATLF